MRFKMMALVAATVLTVPAIAQTVDSTTPAPVPAPKPKKEKKICHKSEDNSYSRMAATVCRTQAEWDRAGNDDGARAGVRSYGGDNAPGN